MEVYIIFKESYIGINEVYKIYKNKEKAEKEVKRLNETLDSTVMYFYYVKTFTVE